MPPHKPNRYEIELKKNLEEARKTVAARDADIEKLRTNLAGKIEEVAALEKEAKEAGFLREINRQLATEVMKCGIDAKDLDQKLRAHELAAIFSKKTIRDLENQNAALRAALREVL